jgi:5-methylcytosine-specific restriction endonuclease McrA
MKTEFILLIGAGFYIADTLHDGKYSSQFVKYKKHFKIVTILFVVFSIYTFIKKNPAESTSMMSHLNGMIKYMPLDKDSRDLITPFLSSSSEQRILTSGGDATSRSVSGTKKKYVAAQQGWKCNDCQSQLDAWFEVDHKTRLADGGSNHIDNLVALCRNCHGKKTTFENL